MNREKIIVVFQWQENDLQQKKFAIESWYVDQILKELSDYMETIQDEDQLIVQIRNPKTDKNSQMVLELAQQEIIPFDVPKEWEEIEREIA